jgi:hypothetical protein
MAVSRSSERPFGYWCLGLQGERLRSRLNVTMGQPDSTELEIHGEGLDAELWSALFRWVDCARIRGLCLVFRARNSGFSFKRRLARRKESRGGEVAEGSRFLRRQAICRGGSLPQPLAVE